MNNQRMAAAGLEGWLLALGLLAAVFALVTLLYR